ncbi:SDR family oxidoreductase [Plastoroseomonas hellenica]|uniref:SDR family oxidoreductase n=1 Tax=Plastoroseomonas hellenica TaxID=2687306 RepID=UPI001BAD248C|nr:SDR family oxidoreductase [Plastoroseomonas hellenica]MBR0642015.1 SDR family oxidoreductase [Plastoroseomonas hellenica]
MTNAATQGDSTAPGRRAAILSLGAAGSLAAFAAAAQQPATTRELAGKSALVTGARHNLGRGYAVALAQMGADILVHHHTPDTRDQAEETARLCRAQGVRTAIFTGDLGRSATVRAMYDAAIAAFDRIDVVVNSAGRIWKGPIAEAAEEEFERCLAINTRGMFFSMQEAARRIAEGGRIINIATSLLCATTPLYGIYAGTKAGIEEFTRTLARELGGRGVTVNAVAPGPIDTPFYRAPESPEAIAYATNAVPARRLGQIDDIVPLVAFLAAPRAQWISGQTIWINGAYGTR